MFHSWWSPRCRLVVPSKNKWMKAGYPPPRCTKPTRGEKNPLAWAIVCRCTVFRCYRDPDVLDWEFCCSKAWLNPRDWAQSVSSQNQARNRTMLIVWLIFLDYWPESSGSLLPISHYSPLNLCRISIWKHLINRQELYFHRSVGAQDHE